ncbi:MAG TPA: IS4 family transposase, partial [Ktedonobacteraceae bacterium]|nr:IS4 family transposase [Ktedonobacteraceae bacterium]
EGFWHWPAIPLLCDQAIYNRLDRAASRMKEFFEQMSHGLRERLLPYQQRELAPFANGVYALDESTLDEVGRWLPELRELCQKEVGLRAGRISALFDVRVQQWWKVDVLQEAETNCKVHARTMMETLPAGALLLFDRGYFAFEWFDELTGRGLFWISRYSNHASYQIMHVCYCGDGVLDAIIRLGNYRSDQARSPVRLLQFWYRGQQYSYLTNVCDPLLLPLAEVVRLYARRWDIELGFRLLKDHLHLRLLWSAKWSVIQVQLWAALLLAQFFHGLQQEIAHQAGVKPEEVSLELLVRLTPRWLQHGIDPVRCALRFGRELGIIRPSSRTNWQLPLVEPSWVTPPSAEVLHPREQARHAHRKCHARSPSHPAPCAGANEGPRVKLKGGVLVPVHSHLLE